MKTTTLKLDGSALTVTENNGDNPDGSAALRSWSFASVADAKKQRAAFAAELDKPENEAVKAALDAAAIAETAEG
jgi:hypothetical protein